MQVKHLYFQHDKNAPYFFQDLSFTLEPAKLHALHGKNGMGKTVLLNIISQRTNPQAIVKGKIINRGKVTLVNQRFDQMLADQFSFEENLRFACMKRFPSPFSRLKSPRLCPAFLERFQINPSKPVNQLSGGQRQILALAMVLQQPMDILLLDEPTATLDESNALLVFEFLKMLLLQKMTLLVVCHDRDLVNHYTTGQQLQLEKDALGIRRLRVLK